MTSARHLGFTLCFLFSFAVSAASNAQEAVKPASAPAVELNLTTRPDPTDSPTEITVRMVILNIEAIKGADQTFTADIAFQAEWQDDRLRHDNDEHVTRKLDDIWHPDFQILNRQRVQFTFPESVKITSDGRVHYVQRAWGQFSQALQLKDFPFDTQTLEINILAPGYKEGVILLKENAQHPSRVAESFSIADWEMVAWKSGTEERALLSGETTFPTFHSSVTMKRNSGYYQINVILPLFLIICMSWIVFWIPSSQIGPRISVSVTAMLTLTAYRFAIGSSLPKIAYLTKLDWFILGSSILVFISLLEVVVTTALVEKDKLKTARTINHSMRWAAPAGFLLIAYFSLF